MTEKNSRIVLFIFKEKINSTRMIVEWVSGIYRSRLRVLVKKFHNIRQSHFYSRVYIF